ncbi:MAG: molybdate ABC transporter permease subunit [Eggerthellaceae bacterium]|nr:molybdate ABC transporter permease subunit [Eggerthellaceae bacterium]
MKTLSHILLTLLSALFVFAGCPTVALAADEYLDDVAISAEGDAAYIEGSSFALNDFTRFEKGSNHERGGAYIGYNYYEGSSPDYAAALQVNDVVIVYIPPSAHALCDASDATSKDEIKAYFCALDEANNKGGALLRDAREWIFTSDAIYTEAGFQITFSLEAEPDKFYIAIMSSTGVSTTPDHADIARIVAPSEVDIVPAATGIAAFGEFLSGIDMSPLWVTLKTTGCAIVFIFILGLAAAYFTMRIPKRAQDIFDTIFTIPMVLPPTVCGFLLLLALGRNTALGQWFIDIGFPLIFSWQATVIAATVVAFPLMYRSCRGAFENLDANMLDAARTLGWSNSRIFFKLMIPLSWSSIAAATVLAFARALGEFGATLFLAGNYVGITQTIPIAIYFEWMGGNMDVAIFWTIVIIIFSFAVILFINLWSRHTTKYRSRGDRK